MKDHKKDVPSIILPPDPSSLTESLRGMGYTLATAVADLIDNSIAANAKNIRVELKKATEHSTPRLSILDDGEGMTRQDLIDAMVLGAVSPLTKRRKSDLGRFGLGLKTASFSQCRCLTVVSKKAGEVSSFSWDLDYLAQTQAWSLIENDPSELADLIVGDQGTLVLWEKIDRVQAMRKGAEQSDWFNLRARLRNHLRLTFHRFLEDGVFKLYLDDTLLKPWDPFMAWEPGKPKDFPESSWPIGSGKPKARMQCFVLPVDPRSKAKRNLFGPEDDLNLQGFYIYRGRRLLTVGGWLGLKDFRKADVFKLARIRLDFENDGDTDWKVDIKKSSAFPPVEMRGWLRQFALQARTISEQTLMSRDTGTAKTVKPHGLWKKPNRGSATLADTSSPIIQTLFNALESGELTADFLNGYLEILALSHPTAIKSNLSYVPTPDARKVVYLIYRYLVKDYGEEKAISILRKTEPFSFWSNLIDEVVGEL